MLLFEEDDVTAAGANTAQAPVLNALGIRADPTWALKADLRALLFPRDPAGNRPSACPVPAFILGKRDRPAFRHRVVDGDSGFGSDISASVLAEVWEAVERKVFD